MVSNRDLLFQGVYFQGLLGGSSQLVSGAVCKGSHNPIPRGRQLIMVIYHLRPSWDDPPSRAFRHVKMPEVSCYRAMIDTQVFSGSVQWARPLEISWSIFRGEMLVSGPY